MTERTNLEINLHEGVLNMELARRMNAVIQELPSSTTLDQIIRFSPANKNRYSPPAWIDFTRDLTRQQKGPFGKALFYLWSFRDLPLSIVTNPDEFAIPEKPLRIKGHIQILPTFLKVALQGEGLETS